MAVSTNKLRGSRWRRLCGLDHPWRMPVLLRRSLVTLGILIALGVSGGLAYWLARPRPIPVTIETTDFPISAPLLVAQRFGDFAACGLAVELHLHATGKQALAVALASPGGYATATETPLMYAACAGQDFAILATIGETGDGLRILARRDAGILVAADLAQRRVAARAGTNAEFYLRSYLHFEGIDPATVTIEDLAPEVAIERLIAGTIAAACLWDPHLRRAHAALPGALSELHEPALYRFTWNLVRTGPASNPDTERRLLDALARASRRIDADPAVRAWLGERFALAAHERDELLQQFLFRPRLTHGLVLAMEDEARLLNGADVAQTIDFTRFIDPAALLAVDANAVRLVR